MLFKSLSSHPAISAESTGQNRIYVPLEPVVLVQYRTLYLKSLSNESLVALAGCSCLRDV